MKENVVAARAAVGRPAPDRTQVVMTGLDRFRWNVMEVIL